MSPGRDALFLIVEPPSPLDDSDLIGSPEAVVTTVSMVKRRKTE